MQDVGVVAVKRFFFSKKDSGRTYSYDINFVFLTKLQCFFYVHLDSLIAEDIFWKRRTSLLKSVFFSTSK